MGQVAGRAFHVTLGPDTSKPDALFWLPGNQQFDYEADQPGSQQVVFVYKRAWEKEPVSTATVDLTVDPSA